MKKEWNSKNCEYAFKRLKRKIEEEKLNINIDYPYLDDLCKETKSPRINDMIVRAYYLGMARGIRSIDEGMTIVTMSEQEISEKDK